VKTGAQDGHDARLPQYALYSPPLTRSSACPLTPTMPRLPVCVAPICHDRAPRRLVETCQVPKGY